MSKQCISVIIPIHNEAPNISLLYQELDTHTRNLPYRFEFIFVDDGSSDESFQLLQKIATSDKRLRLLEFARNFGKEAAVSAGLHTAKGQAAIIMDADLQHPPAIIHQFIAAWEQGADVVVGVKQYSRDESWLKRATSALYYKLLTRVSSTRITPHASDYRLLDRIVIDTFCKLTERNRMTRGMIDWLGFRRQYIKFEAPPRAAGVASYSYRKLIGLAMNSVTAYSLFPLKLAGYLGGFILLIAGPAGAFLTVENYVFGDPWHWNITGTAMLAMLNLILVGVILACIGLVALYIARIHAEVANRPLYIIRRDVQANEAADLADDDKERRQVPATGKPVLLQGVGK